MIYVSIYGLLVENRTYFSIFFFNDTATTEIYTLSLHDALPIFHKTSATFHILLDFFLFFFISYSATTNHFILENITLFPSEKQDRKSTRLNSSHANISYAVFCLKKKNIRSDILPTSRTHSCITL